MTYKQNIRIYTICLCFLVQIEAIRRGGTSRSRIGIPKKQKKKRIQNLLLFFSYKMKIQELKVIQSVIFVKKQQSTILVEQFSRLYS